MEECGMPSLQQSTEEINTHPSTAGIILKAEAIPIDELPPDDYNYIQYMRNSHSEPLVADGIVDSESSSTRLPTIDDVAVDISTLPDVPPIVASDNSGVSMKGSTGKHIAGGSFSQGPNRKADSDLDVLPAHTWSTIPSNLFVLRVGPNYKKNKTKAPSPEAFYDAAGVE